MRGGPDGDDEPRADGAVVDRVTDALRSVESPLARLATVVQVRDHLDELEAESVAEARAAGATWSEVGATIGTTRQGAWNRWGRS